MTQVHCTQSPCPCSRPLLTCTPTGDTQTFKGRSGSVGSLGPGAHKVLFKPSEHLGWVWSLILNVILPLLPSYWGLSSALGRGVSFFGGIQHSPVDGCWAEICNFGVLAGEDECMSFYSAILWRKMSIVRREKSTVRLNRQLNFSQGSDADIHIFALIRLSLWQFFIQSWLQLQSPRGALKCKSLENSALRDPAFIVLGALGWGAPMCFFL